MKLKYLITGTGRCGTVYMARLLTHLGVPCGHETIFDWRGLEVAKKRLSGQEKLQLSYCSTVQYVSGSWIQLPIWLPNVSDIEAESSYMATPYLSEDFLKETVVVHVVRNPLRVVNSFCNHIDYFQSSKPNNSYEQFVYTHLPELTAEMPPVDRACLFYVRWNQMVTAPILHRIEDDPAKVISILGLQGQAVQDKTINSMKKRGVRSFALQDIQSVEIRKEFVDLGRRYGYQMQSECLLM